MILVILMILIMWKWLLLILIIMCNNIVKMCNIIICVMC